ncbi:helix-turn-helix domain-containing protein [Nocardia carnea]|uniref:helix-turn-helix domain-containing protein n=1 Tax=Nocardia carnea TaxID=37328 RepID=UPI0024555CDC|nr:hypothetical protein [Nocardia carnea]
MIVKWTGVEVRALRTEALRRTQREFAEMTGFSEAVIRKWESRGRTATLTGQYAAGMDTLFARLDNAQRMRLQSTLDIPAPTGGTTSADATYEDPIDIGERLQQIALSDIDDAVSGSFELALDRILDRYEAIGPHRLARDVIALRRKVEALLHRKHRPAKLAELYLLAAKLSGVLGYMSVNQGQFRYAKLYCQEAFALASLVDDDSLKAWVRGTESFCAYYQGEFRAAAELARDGIRISGDGPESIRLYANGLARALGKLGDRAGVDAAIGAADSIALDHRVGTGLTAALSFAPYGQARLAANAVTAYLSIGQYDRVLELGRPIVELADNSDSAWSRALVGLDLATAVLRHRARDAEESVHLGIQALTASDDRPIRSVWQRGHELGADLTAMPSGVSQTYLNFLREWAQAAKPLTAPEDPAPAR